MTMSRVGVDIFPNVDAGEFRIRLRAQDGTHIDVTEKLAIAVLESVKEDAGPNKVDLSLGYVGTVPASFPINAVYQFTRGPEEAILRIAFKPHSGVNTEKLKSDLRIKFATQFPNARFSFEPSDIISDVMSFGSSTPVEVAVRGGSLAENKDFAKKAQEALKSNKRLKDVQIVQSLDYPTVDVRIDREKSGIAGATMDQVGRSVLAATSSSRFVVPNYWPDPKSGIGYQVQVEIPQVAMKSLSDLGTVPVLHREASPLLLRDVAQITQSTMPGEFDRYNMKRELSLTANLDGTDLGSISGEISKILDRVKKEDDTAKDALVKAGEKPGRISYEIRGQIPPLKQMLSGLGVGLLLAILAIFLLLAANFQSFRLSAVAVSTAPAVVAGAACMLWLTGTTLNIQSFIGTIMGLGVAMANAILVVTFAEQRRKSGESALAAARHGATDRLRPVLMTSCAMLAGMLPMAIGFGESGQQTAPLGLSVIGSLLAATFSTLFVLPAVFAWVQSNRSTKSVSLHPLDRESTVFIDESIKPSNENQS
jgi:multidrug efflux pump subunit AcrB